MEINKSNLQELIYHISDSSDRQFINTGNSIQYTGIRASINEVLGTPMCIYQAALNDVDDLNAIKFIGVWGRAKSFRNILDKKISEDTLVYTKSEFPEFPIKMQEQDNENGVIYDYEKTMQEDGLDMEKYIGILVYIENDVHTKIIITRK